jgi:hypothetical protein
LVPDGTFRLYTNVGAHLLVDISGYFDGGSTLPPGGLSGTITAYELVESLSETNVLGDVSNGSSEDFRFVRVELNVRCPGLHTSGATIKAIVDL